MDTKAPASCPAHSGGEATLSEDSTPHFELDPSLRRVSVKDAEIAEEVVLALSERTPRDGAARTGILLVSHGSHSSMWRRLLLDVHHEVSDQLLSIEGVGEVRSAFMEYTEPSIATQLRAFDQAGFDSVIVVPLLLTISDHSYDDIPAICGRSDDQAKIDELEAERIEIYQAQAEIDFAPLMDFSDLVQRSVVRRIRAITGRREEDGSDQRFGVLLVGYGSGEFEDEWNRFFAEIRNGIGRELGIAHTAHAWCGHLVGYSREPTSNAIESLLQRVDRVVVVPVFVAHDPMFQDKIIGRAVERCGASERVLYRPDAILPDPEVSRWVIDISRQMAASGAVISR